MKADKYFVKTLIFAFIINTSIFMNSAINKGCNTANNSKVSAHGML
jgi:hypothetical protein